jgi:hypothetical protein
MTIRSNVDLIAATSDVRAQFIERYTATESGTERQVEARLRARWSRAVKQLLKYNVIETNQTYIWMTGKPVQGARVSGAREWDEIRGAADPAPVAVDQSPKPPNPDDEVPLV